MQVPLDNLVGTEGESYCFTGCDDGPGSCGKGYVCSPEPLTSVLREYIPPPTQTSSGETWK